MKWGRREEGRGRWGGVSSLGTAILICPYREREREKQRERARESESEMESKSKSKGESGRERERTRERKREGGREGGGGRERGVRVWQGMGQASMRGSRC